MDNNEKLKNKILEDFKVLNNIIITKTPDEENLEETQKPNYDNVFKLYIDKSIQEILNLTNRLYFPIELRYVVLDMINDFYTINKARFTGETSTETSSKVDDSYIKSLSEEGRSVTFASTSEMVLNSLLSKHIASELDNRQKQIYRYRLLYKELPRKENTYEED